MPEAISNKIKNMGIVCAMLVPFIHVGRPSVAGRAGWWFYQLTAEGVSRCAVPFFFICSGYFLARHFFVVGWYRTEIKKRIKTLLVPYLLWSLIFYLFISALSLIAPDNPICYRVVKSMSPVSRLGLSLGLLPEKLPMLYPLWYVRFLFLLILLSPVFAFVVKHLKLSMFVVLGTLYLLFNPGDGSPVGVHIGFPFEGVFYFYCGIVLQTCKIEVWNGLFNPKLGILAGGGRLC